MALAETIDSGQSDGPDIRFVQGPMHPEFGFDDSAHELFAAVERGTLSPEDCVRIFELLDRAPNKATVEEIMVREFYYGPTSPDPVHPPEHYHAA